MNSVLREGIDQTERLEYVFSKKWRDLFTPKDNIAWVNWINHEKREEQDLKNLLSRDVRDSIKARALYLLLVYDRNCGDIYWNRKLYALFGEITFPEILSPRLLNFTANMIVEFFPKISDLREPSDNHAFYFYCNAMINLMTLLEIEESKMLLEHFPLNDYQTKSEESTECKPFSMLINDKLVPDQLKSIATNRMIETMLQLKKEHGSYDKMLNNFANTILLNLHSKDLIPYGTDLFAKQIDFLIRERSRKKIINDFNVGTILSIFDSEEYMELRKRFIKFVVLENGNQRYNANDDAELNTARRMLSEIENSGNQKLNKILRRIISEGETYISQTSTTKNNKQDMEQELLQAMS